MRLLLPTLATLALGCGGDPARLQEAQRANLRDLACSESWHPLAAEQFPPTMLGEILWMLHDPGAARCWRNTCLTAAEIGPAETVETLTAFLLRAGPRAPYLSPGLSGLEAAMDGLGRLAERFAGAPAAEVAIRFLYRSAHRGFWRRQQGWRLAPRRRPGRIDLLASRAHRVLSMIDSPLATEHLARLSARERRPVRPRLPAAAPAAPPAARRPASPGP